MRTHNDRLLIWGDDIEDATIRQAERTARLGIVHGHMALMPDAHVGIGSTVGSVIPTLDAVIPAAIGVDVGCGMAAVRLNVTATDLPDDLDRLLPLIEQAVPAGLGKGHEVGTRSAEQWLEAHPVPSDIAKKFAKKALQQFGSLGSGNHFYEVCLDEQDRVWVVLHSGSRGMGKEVAEAHIRVARQLAKTNHVHLEDPSLAHFIQNTPEFDAYIVDMLWAQAYARGNRDAMMDAALREVTKFIRKDAHRRIEEVERVNCHHNFTEQEEFDGQRVWITRKGAIKADVGDRGIIPGSMGTRSYIVTGLGNKLSWNSCSHGAGRRMSRRAAKDAFTASDLARQMEGRVWLSDRADQLVDEIPAAYKDIDQVMAAQQDLVRVDAVLHAVLNYKGT